MGNLLILPTENSPFIYGNFERGELLILGRSTPIYIVDIMKPTEEWISNYLESNHNPLHLHLDLCFYDTPTSLMITSILRTLKSSKCKFSVSWYYYSEDEDMLEEGEDLELLASIPFRFVEEAYKSETNILKTDTSPLVYFDSTGDFIIQGHCNLENPLVFFRPVLKWLSENLVNPVIEKVLLDIHLLSVSSSNVPYIKAVVNIIEAIKYKDIKTTIEWNYSSKEIEKLGEEFLNPLSSHYFFKQVNN
jgi:hypothetical protein